MVNLGALTIQVLKSLLLYMLILKKNTVHHIKVILVHNIKILILQSLKPKRNIFLQENRMKMQLVQSKDNNYIHIIFIKYIFLIFTFVYVAIFHQAKEESMEDLVIKWLQYQKVHLKNLLTLHYHLLPV
jgi:hypothetical protein